MTWREKDHPRDDDGRFTDRWAGAVSGAIGAGLGEHPYVRGQDLTSELDYDGIAPLLPDPTRSFWSTGGDQVLSRIYDAQGYHGLPELVDQDRLDEMIAREGYIELWRGVNGKEEGVFDSDRVEVSRQQAEQFRTGSVHHPGFGGFGNGTYSTQDQGDARTYAVVDGRYPARGPLHDPDDPDYHDYDAEYRWPGLIRLALRPDARVIDYDDADSAVAPYVEHTHSRPDSKSQVLIDEGRLAAAMGYDAIRRRLAGGDVYIILNRTAVAVQPWTPPPMPPTLPQVRVSASHLREMLALGNEYEVLIEDSGNWMHAVRWTTEDGRPFLVDKDGQWMGIEGERSFLTRLVKS